MDERNKDPLANISIRLGNETKRIPLFSNPSVKESRSANYAEASILYRNEPVKLYTGTAAKRVSFEFTMHSRHYEYMNADMSVATYLDYIRATVLSTKKEPKQAPPVVTIEMGEQFGGIERPRTLPPVPFVVMSYRIMADDKAGVDSKTLNPIQHTVSLNLEEYRQEEGVNHEDLPGQEDVIKGDYLV